jgi:hypothetical protein
MKLGFQNFYVYSSVSPATGEDFTLIVPQVNAMCFNVYLAEFSKFLGNRKAILVVDGAGWHKAKELKVPTNIMFVFLPPYSPELNPVERLWKFIKDNTIKNRIFANLDDLEQALSCFIKTMAATTLASICHTDYI